ncbi:MAG: SAM-dependent DNA methyltransferase, partial [Selenomonadaceae bacterium]|nr:SAM-dependent DNA methyltransferase [Selenomonadaceae bacterium]
MDEFIAEWKSRGNEKSDCHPFWIAAFKRFWKKVDPETEMKFEVPVQIGDSQCYIDIWIPKTRVIIEQKSRGKSLDKLERQSDGSMLNPFNQAKRYDDHRKTSEKARWIVTCNFDEIWIYNLEADRPEKHVKKILLEELPERFSELDFLVDEKQSDIYTAEFISASAGSLVQDFRDLFFDSISEMSQDEIDSLNKFCIRCVFCMYSEDAEVFKRKAFLNYLKDARDKSLEDVKTDLSNLFWRLSLKDEELPRGIDPRLKEFDYVDGDLFDGEDLLILDRLDGNFDLRRMLDKLIDAAEKNIWRKISPTIFGSIFESIMNPDNRREGGIHFTSEKNIHKVIDPLFLDNLNSEFETCEDLEKFHDKIGSLIFFDPACGSGNFLTETFISLRKLENRVIEKIGGKIKVTIENFYGIEINDWAVQVAKLALWISEHQMNGNENFLPLKRNANITEANSLTTDWDSVISRDRVNFVMGNPPYSGARVMGESQKSDVQKVFEGWKNLGNLDYVACWFKKASDYIRGTKIESAFVSTDSICQGDSVGILWKPLFEDEIKINFAWSSFKWENETHLRKFMAQVFCVIVGFSRFDRSKKFIDGVEVSKINAYLLDAPMVCVEGRSDPIRDVAKMTMGSMPNDDGNLIIESEDLDEFLEKDPRSKKFIRRFMMGKEFIHNLPRYCLWLVDAKPNEIKSIKPIYNRINEVRKFRKSSKRETTRKLAETAYLFGEIRQPTDGSYIVMPQVTSGNRKYIPIGFLDSKVIAGDKLLIIPNGSLDLFGVLTSRIHMIWTRAIGGRLGNGYSYSIRIVYNNFPFPNLNSKQKSKIEKTAQKILDVRSKYPDSSLAELYDPLSMPIDLQKAHNENDRAVLDA